jgi:hypothetical protein
MPFNFSKEREVVTQAAAKISDNSTILMGVCVLAVVVSVIALVVAAKK